MPRLLHIALLVPLVACGQPNEARVPAVSGTSPVTGSPAHAAPTPADLRICNGVHRMVTMRCPPFADFGEQEQAAIADCSIAPAMYIAGMQDCVQMDSCDKEQRCASDVVLKGTTYRGPTTSCAGGSVNYPVGVGADELEASYGQHDRRFSDSPSSRTRPIEVCGIFGETDYLARVTCDDGSRPFADRGVAHEARAGNVGHGGRCGRVIDQYPVRCPEKTYDVFIDLYRCPAAP